MLSLIFKDFFNGEKSGGFILIICTVFSLLLANSVFGMAYQNFWHTTLFSKPIEFWINDALMSIFFLLIGLEIEREIYIGELSDLKNALLPISAAIGGMFVPALIYFLFNQETKFQSGIAIPTATDIAFSLGILSLFGSRIPNSLKIFLTALAIVDDLGAIIIIALFYAKDFSISYFGISMLLLGLLVSLNRFKIKFLPIYLSLGIMLWFCFLKSGIHPTIAGVLLAFTIPFDRNNDNSPSNRLEHAINKPVAYFILPLFALANTCILIPTDWLSGLCSSNSLGIVFGLVMGKPIGIVLFSFISVTLGFCALPLGIKLRQFVGVAMLAGIGFTMSIFITLLAFSDTEIIIQSKIAILIASLISVIGSIFLLAPRNQL